MTARLVTQSVETLPTLVLFRDDSPLADLVVRLLTKSNLNVIRVSTTSDGFTERLKKLQGQEIFKAVWVNHLMGDGEVKNAQELTEYLQKLDCSITLVFSTTTVISAQDRALAAWQKMSSWQQQFFQSLRQSLPAALTIAVQDLFLAHGVNSYPWTTLFSLLNKGQLIDPGVVISPLLLESLVPSLKSYLFNPWKNKTILIRGEKILSTTFFAQLNDLYSRMYGQQLLLVPTAKVIATEDSQIYKTVEISNVNELINHLSSALPQIKRQLPLEENKRSLATPGVRMLKRAAEVAVQVVGLAENRQLPTKPSVEEKIEKNIEQQLQQIFKQKRVSSKVERVFVKVEKTKKIVKKQKRRKAAFVIGMFWLGSVLATLVLVAGFYLNYQLVRTKTAMLLTGLEENNTQVVADQALTQAERKVWALELQLDTYQKLLDLPWFSQVRNDLNFYAALKDSLVLLHTQKKNTQLAVQQILGETQGDGLETIRSSQMITDQLYQQLSLLYAQLKNNSSHGNQLKTLENYLSKTRRSLIVSDQLEPILPQILGVDTKKTYLVILQDDQELRPTGGFIQAAALITFDQHRLVDVQTKSVYQLDNQLTGTISPPADLTRFLGEKRWFLRDSNWSPDFTVSAQEMSRFIDASTGKQINGVIALNLYSLQKILGALGPVELPELGEILTDKNIFERFESHSEVQVVERLDRETYSAAVLRLVLEGVQTMPPDRTSPLLTAVMDSLEQKQLLIAFTSANLNKSFNDLGWSGALLSPDCPAQLNGGICQVDSLMQVEANVGINKANAYLKRDTQHQIEISSNLVTHTRTMVFTNQANSNAWPLGSYQAYLRFFVSPEDELVSIEVDGQKLADEQLVFGQELEKQVWGMALSVPINTTKQVTLKYRRRFSSLGAYSYFEQLQPGVVDGQPQVVFVIPPPLTPKLIAPQAKVDGQVIRFLPAELDHTFVGAAF